MNNDHIKKCLANMVEKDAVCNSLLFAGPAGVGKGQFALDFAKMLLEKECENHPDLRIYRPEGKIGMHSIDSMRSLTEEVYLSPYQAKWKVFIVHDAERMLSYSANALLKTFEEPGPQSVIILLSSSPEKLIPTIRSRCRTLFFHGEGKQPEPSSRLLDALAANSLSDYRNLLQFSKELAVELEQNQDEELPSTDDLTAQQKEAVKKEWEGAKRLSLSTEFDAFLKQLLGWYRDLHLIHCQGDVKHLTHPSRLSDLENSLQRGNLLPLEKIHEHIAEAKLSFDRSTSLQICLENLFLKISH